jgi:hypothetical protein
MGDTKELQSSTYKQVKDLFLNKGMTARAIYEEMGGKLTYTSVRTYIARVISEAKANGVHIAPREKSPAHLARKPISELHHMIGIKLMQHRLLAMSGMEPQEYANEFGVGNRMSLALMEHGKYDFRLSELVAISNNLELSLQDLLNVPVHVTGKGATAGP